MSDLLKPAKAAVDAKAFSEALKQACGVLKKSNIPVLSEVYIHISSGECMIAGTNLNDWVILKIPARGDDLAFVFSRTKDVERVCRCFDGCLTLEMAAPSESGGLVTLSCGSRTGEFETYPAEDYPVIPELPGEVSFSANAAALLERISKVAYATKKPGQSTKEITSCVEFSGDQIFTLDGQRVAWDQDSTLIFPQPFLIHAESLRLLKLFGKSQVNFYLSRPYLYVTDEKGTTVILRVEEGAPFQLHSAIPQKYMEEFWVSPKKVLSELKYLSDAAPKSRLPYVFLRGNELFTLVNSKKYSTMIDAGRQNVQTIAFALRHITDAFKQFGTEPRVKVKISGTKTPAVIEAEGRSDCALILPIPIKENAAA